MCKLCIGYTAYNGHWWGSVDSCENSFCASKPIQKIVQEKLKIFGQLFNELSTGPKKGFYRIGSRIISMAEQQLRDVRFRKSVIDHVHSQDHAYFLENVKPTLIASVIDFLITNSRKELAKQESSQEKAI